MDEKVPDKNRRFAWICVNCGSKDVLSSSAVCEQCDVSIFNQVQNVAEQHGAEAGYEEHDRIISKRVRKNWRYLDEPIEEIENTKSDHAINSLLEFCQEASKDRLKKWTDFWDDMFLACEYPNELSPDHPLVLNRKLHEDNISPNELRARRQTYRKVLLQEHKYYRELATKFHFLLSQNPWITLRQHQEYLDYQSSLPSCWWPTVNMEYYADMPVTPPPHI